MNAPVIELADIINQFGQEFIDQKNPLGYHKGVLHAIKVCRTSVLGGHIDRCDTCGHIRISYNSCRNRHCPKCQGVNQLRWIMAREADLLPVGYFHLVFTLPDVLNPLCLKYPAAMYNLLFQCVRDTLFGFAANPKHLGAEIGFIAVLHTWGQSLTLHPHLHCVVPAGGLSVNGTWRNPIGGENYLFPVEAMSSVFRGKFRDGLKTLSIRTGFDLTLDLLRKMHQSDWVVYAKEPFTGPTQVIRYLGRYTHRVAISNHRLVTIQNGQVTFRYKDYRDKNRQKIMSLSGIDFLQRFCLHILPRKFVRIRHYGILSSRRKPELRKLQSSPQPVVPVENHSGKADCEKRSWQEVSKIRMRFDPMACPCCCEGRMQIIEIVRPRSPPAVIQVVELRPIT